MYKDDNWNQLKKTISLVASKNFDYKTIIRGSSDHLYLVVTRVNFMTASLWLERRNKIVDNGLGGNHKGFIELSKKPNWLVMTKSFRADENIRIKELEVV